ncbi:MAG: hypothetical protein WA956_05675 [Stenotrophomonas sp.]
MRKIALVAALLACCSTAAAKNVVLPDNVTLRPGNMSGSYIDTVRAGAGAASFSKLKLCLAQNVSNPSLMITGGTNAPFSFNPHGKTQTTAVQGGDIFKYQDEGERTAIVMGSVAGANVVLSRRIIRFELTATANDDGTALTFTNIEHATENTGSVENSGFTPVGAWKGAKPLSVIEALDGLAARIASCLR